MVLLSDILLFPQVSITILVDSLLFLLLCVAFFFTIVILKYWDRDATTSYQYQLEKQSYLVITIISFALFVKILLLPFFTYTLNELSTIVPGAMCAAGVVSANEYGNTLLILKIFIIMLTLLWLVLDAQDQRAKNYPYFRYKMWFFVTIFSLISIELLLQFLFLTNISTASPVLCCSVIYKDDSNPLPFNLSTIQLIMLFFILTVAVITTAHLKKRIMLFILSIFYTYISYYTITYFFSRYIYELPTHKCPFCILQSDYLYIGYFIFGSLFLATFNAISASIFKFESKRFKHSIVWYIIFTISTSFHFFFYLLKNGVFL